MLSHDATIQFLLKTAHVCDLPLSFCSLSRSFSLFSFFGAWIPASVAVVLLFAPNHNFFMSFDIAKVFHDTLPCTALHMEIHQAFIRCFFKAPTSVVMVKCRLVSPEVHHDAPNLVAGDDVKTIVPALAC